MAQPWLPEELAFIAEEEVNMAISPHFSSAKIKFMGGDYGPFVAGRPVKVPMWLGLFLHSSNSCTPIPPKWLNVSFLKKALEKEKSDRNDLTKLPSHYMEVSFTFFVRCPEVVKDADQVRGLIEDLWGQRIEKLRRSVIVGSSETQDTFALPNATRMELHMFREPITKITSTLTSLNSMRTSEFEDDE